MGKQLQTFPVIYPGTNNIGFPVKAGTWDFLQAAYNEQFASVIISIIGSSYSSTQTYILYGCVLSTGGGNTTITSGAIFFNGEIFQYAGQTITGTTNVVCNLLNTPFTESDLGGTPMADPVSFIGGATVNVHISRTPVFSLGTSGTGMFQSQCSGGTSTSANNDYNNFINFSLLTEINQQIAGNLNGLAAAFGTPSGTYLPVIVSGCTSVGYGFTSGYFFYNGLYYYLEAYTGISLPVLRVNLTVTNGQPTAYGSNSTSAAPNATSFNYSLFETWVESPPISTYSESLGFNGETITFNNNNTYQYLGSSSSVNTLILNPSLAVVGKTSTIIGVISPTQTIAFSTSGTYSFYVNASSLTAPSGCTYCTISITYLGSAGTSSNAYSIIVSYI